MQRQIPVTVTASASGASLLQAPEAMPAKPSHVLIADANARTLAARAEQLMAAGLRVSMAHTTFETIVKASCHVPDLILLDGRLADLDAALTPELLTTCPVTSHIPIVRLAPGRRVPRKVLSAALRSDAVQISGQ